MLTLDILYAVLMGLSPSYLKHLDVSWSVFCGRIHKALKQGHPPLAALKLALQQVLPPEAYTIRKTLTEIQPVMQLPGLTFRQKEALIALRSAKVASLTHLSRVLNTDRANLHRRLAALVRKGYALKFFGEKGIHYAAVQVRLDKSVRTGVFHLLQDYLHRLEAGTLPEPSWDLGLKSKKNG